VHFLSHLTYCTPTKSTLYLANSLAAVKSALTFHVPNKMSLFCCAILPLETLPPWRSEWGSSLPPDCFVSRGSILTYEYYLTWIFSQGGVVSTSPNPQAGGPPLVGCPQLLIQFIHSYPPYRRPFLHPQPENVPCRGDRDPYSLQTGSSSQKPSNLFK
jgi:hypothetical protein